MSKKLRLVARLKNQSSETKLPLQDCTAMVLQDLGMCLLHLLTRFPGDPKGPKICDFTYTGVGLKMLGGGPGAMAT